MKRFSPPAMAAVATLSLALISLPAANAAPPKGPDDLHFDLEAGVGCDFHLLVDGTGSKVKRHKFTDRNGNPVRVIEAGKGYTLVYTNADTGESITFTSNGSVSNTVIDPKTGIQTVSITGHTGLILFPSDIPEGPSTTQYIGKVVYTVDTAGVFEVQSEAGQSFDVCAALS
ncbi:hypothetical protein QFZ36_000392 [Pseudarthrobacter siccitolerans]|uniref:Uncharacterized protein n=1 Tax=Pseudarthrobacter siccitolerans TaxID=861266 RepID=A0ABU0PHS6_9MICC|nr:hypothetical protein [Pseudarthrobacter siccitolerans]MDQ0672831.1 hypothetical protein [Pseudarthrobacter siccitolerans]